MSRAKTMPIALAVFAAGALGVWGWKAANRGGAPTGGSAGEARHDPNHAAARPVFSGDAISPAFAALDGKPAAARISLLDLQKSLAAMPKAEAVALIRGFLNSGKDRPTGLSFTIGKDGSLTEWPTFRAFLLDALLAIDPAAAAAIGREILAQPTSADEWALALRNVARGEPPEENADFLRRKTEELIANPAWQADPSIGYLNAFDVLVYLAAADSTPLLSGLLQRKDRKDLAHAGFLTLDRLVQRQPADLLTRLAADRALQQSRPEMVAQQFARADLRDSAQQVLMKAWLLDPARTPVELRSFAGVYPNNNRFVSNNLLTVESGQSGEDLATHDRAALETITAWAADPAFQPLKAHLDQMVSRLEGFVSARENPSTPVSPPSPE
jgi:hypothetical protein